MTRPGDRAPSERNIPRKPIVRGSGGPLGRGGSPEEQSLEEGHELRDMRVRQVIRWLALLTAAVVVLIVLVTVFERGMLGHIGVLSPVVEDVPKVTPPPQPRLEQTNGEILSALHMKEDKILNNYTWIDQGAGTVSLPIDRAIELTAQRGLPVHPGGTDQAASGVALPQGSSSGRTSETIP
jgi:hypothetical protein